MRLGYYYYFTVIFQEINVTFSFFNLLESIMPNGRICVGTSLSYKFVPNLTDKFFVIGQSEIEKLAEIIF